jgi:hypothetical protein
MSGSLRSNGVTLRAGTRKNRVINIYIGLDRFVATYATPAVPS